MKTDSPGFSLIELMVSLVIASLLLTALLRVYFYFQAHYKRLETQLSESYEVQLVDTLLRDEIRRAGFTPCLPLNSLTNDDLLKAFQINGQVLTLQRMGEPTYPIQIIDLTHLVMDSTEELDRSKVYLLADCYHAELIRLGAVSHSSGHQHLTLIHSLKFHYIHPVYLGEWVNESFYIQAKPNPVLMYKFRHADVLSPEIIGLHAEERMKRGRYFLDVQLQMKKQVHTMSVSVRSR